MSHISLHRRAAEDSVRSETDPLPGDESEFVNSACHECGFSVRGCDGTLDFVDLETARRAIDRVDALLILPTEAIVRFHPATPEQLVNGCLAAGFRSVFFELLGDELVAAEYVRLLHRSDRKETWIRSTSPLVVEHVRAEYPELVPHLAPIVTPAVALTRYLRLSFPNFAILYAGVHSAGPDPTDTVDGSISLDQLRQLLEDRGAVPSLQPHALRTLPPERRRYLSVPGGLPRPMLDEQPLSSNEFMRVRGLHTLSVVSWAIRNDRRLGFVDLLPFEGTLDHPALGPHEELLWRREITALAEGRGAVQPVLERPDGLDLAAWYEPWPQSGTEASDLEAIVEQITTGHAGRWDREACQHVRCGAAVGAARRGTAPNVCPYYMLRRYESIARDASHDRTCTAIVPYMGDLRRRLREPTARTRCSRCFFWISMDSSRQTTCTGIRPATRSYARWPTRYGPLSARRTSPPASEATSLSSYW